MTFDIAFLKRVFLARILIPIHRDGYPFITLIAIASILIGLLWGGAFIFGLIAILSCIYIFRHPKRTVPKKESVVVSAVDGIIEDIKTVKLSSDLGFQSKEAICISILTGLGDAHVTRVPVSGFVKEIRGGFDIPPGRVEANKLKRCQYQITSFETDDKSEVGFVQYAGPFKRLIVSQLQNEQSVKIGDVSGIVRFFSHSDLYVPTTANVNVQLDQRCLAGETIIAEMETKAVPVKKTAKSAAKKKTS